MTSPSKKKRLVNEAFSRVEALIEQVRKEAADACAVVAVQVEELHKQEAVILHNRLGAVIEELKPAPDNTLLVLELLRHEVVNMIVARMAERPQQEEAALKKE